VIVVNWNGEAYLAECVDSLLKQTYPLTEVLVVDNASSDGSVRLILDRYGDRVRLIANRRNSGFAGGNNIGIAASKGAYVLLLNNDAAADPRWVAALVREAEVDPRIGMCASKILTWEDADVLDSAGLLLFRDGLGRGRGRLERDDGRFARGEEVLLPSACAALYRRAMLDEIGLLDETFFMYCEDMDLGLRARLAGWRCRYVPDAVVRHRYSATAGRYSVRKVFLVERNRIWVMVKTFPLSALAVSPFWTIVRLVRQAYAGWRGHGGAGRALEQASPFGLVLAVGRAYWAAARGLPTMWKARRGIARLRRVERSAFHQWLHEYGVSTREIATKE
jgi:GT2 family glycosyltransferase